MKITKSVLKQLIKEETRKALKEGEMKRIHMAIMDRLAEIKAEFDISSEDIKVILDDMDSQEEYAAASQEEPTAGLSDEELQADMDNMPVDMKRRLAY